MSFGPVGRLQAAIVTAISVVASSAVAEGYPDRPLELLIPFSAGGANDQVARQVAGRLEAILGQPVAPINRTGAGGYVAAQEVVTGPADGYKLAHESLGTFILTSLFEKQAIDPVADVRYVAQMAQLTSAIAVSSDSPYQTLDDLLAAMREAPGEMTWGHTGRGGFHHVNGVGLFQAAGVEAIDIPFQGSSASVADLMGGHIDAAVLSSSNYIGFENELRFLAFMSEGRDAVLPDVPTVGELGIEMAFVETPSVVVVNKDTPDDVVDQLEAAIETVVAQEDYQQALLKMGVTPQFATGDAIVERITTNLPRWQQVIDSTRDVEAN
ncbi:tripartite tricarboxylate transporter substrate binding protein [Paracoccus sp. M683]|uniref:Bug family tripartite tricarboxylate transporter substrate binding protein n=1 Tax=Paracoccus sp. M683 TaxID=2594268 RepID=UPI00117E22FC|nr:tripartite tricarboxylate transporter substrate binding protein [Paracoccus sp. M683]TRW94585.1 tripartite tricarboxylate transporter substrate binding protein [Paracoccus sp. M683]